MTSVTGAGPSKVPAMAVIAMVVMMAIVAGCGSEDGGSPPGVTVTDARFDGRFELIEAVLDDGEASAAGGIVFEFDAEFGALAVETPCATLLGSYSLFADGTAGITITGSRDRDCTATEADRDVALRAALDRVEAWGDAGGGFELRSAGERDRLLLVS